LTNKKTCAFSKNLKIRRSCLTAEGLQEPGIAAVMTAPDPGWFGPVATPLVWLLS